MWVRLTYLAIPWEASAAPQTSWCHMQLWQRTFSGLGCAIGAAPPYMYTYMCYIVKMNFTVATVKSIEPSKMVFMRTKSLPFWRVAMLITSSKLQRLCPTMMTLPGISEAMAGPLPTCVQYEHPAMVQAFWVRLLNAYAALQSLPEKAPRPHAVPPAGEQSAT